jgi:predicted PurR-regulated permease PerM
MSNIGKYAFAVGGAITNLVLVVIAGVFLASEPRLYRRGFLKLFPEDRHEAMAHAFDNTARALHLWLLGQLASMLIIGAFTWLGLWLVGVPSALMLGVIAGLAEFVPLLGPIFSAVPGLLLALLISPETALWALVVYVGIQQIESNLITPLVERRAVSLPPVVTLFGVLAMGVTFGFLGLLLSAPLTVVTYVLIKQLYVRDTLGQPTQVPGEKDS